MVNKPIGLSLTADNSGEFSVRTMCNLLYASQAIHKA